MLESNTRTFDRRFKSFFLNTYKDLWNIQRHLIIPLSLYNSGKSSSKMCPDFGKDLPVEASDLARIRSVEERSVNDARTAMMNHQTKDSNQTSTSGEEEPFSEAMRIVEEMLRFLENSERDLGEPVDRMYTEEEEEKTEFSIEEADSQDSSPVQYHLKTTLPSSATTPDSFSNQINEQSSSTEIITLTSDEEEEAEQENKSKRLKPWPKKVDPDEQEFYHFENPYSHLEYQSDTE